MSENGHASSSAAALHRPELVRTNSEKTDYEQTDRMMEEVKQHTHEAMVWPPPQLAATAHIRDMELYRHAYHRSIHDSDAFWKEVRSAAQQSTARQLRLLPDLPAVADSCRPLPLLSDG